MGDARASAYALDTLKLHDPLTTDRAKITFMKRNLP